MLHIVKLDDLFPTVQEALEAPFSPVSQIPLSPPGCAKVKQCYVGFVDPRDAASAFITTLTSPHRMSPSRSSARGTDSRLLVYEEQSPAIRRLPQSAITLCGRPYQAHKHCKYHITQHRLQHPALVCPSSLPSAPPRRDRERVEPDFDFKPLSLLFSSSSIRSWGLTEMCIIFG